MTASKKNKGSKKGSDEVSLLQLNQQMSSNEKQKVAILGDILVSLQVIHSCLHNITGLLHSVVNKTQPEQ